MMGSVQYYALYLGVMSGSIYNTWFCAKNIICCTFVFMMIIKINGVPFGASQILEFLKKVRCIAIHKS